jgi:hypothetical protein
MGSSSSPSGRIANIATSSPSPRPSPWARARGRAAELQTLQPPAPAIGRAHGLASAARLQTLQLFRPRAHGPRTPKSCKLCSFSAVRWPPTAEPLGGFPEFLAMFAAFRLIAAAKPRRPWAAPGRPTCNVSADFGGGGRNLHSLQRLVKKREETYVSLCEFSLFQPPIRQPSSDAHIWAKRPKHCNFSADPTPEGLQNRRKHSISDRSVGGRSAKRCNFCGGKHRRGSKFTRLKTAHLPRQASRTCNVLARRLDERRFGRKTLQLLRSVIERRAPKSATLQAAAGDKHQRGSVRRQVATLARWMGSSSPSAKYLQLRVATLFRWMGSSSPSAKHLQPRLATRVRWMGSWGLLEPRRAEPLCQILATESCNE